MLDYLYPSVFCMRTRVSVLRVGRLQHSIRLHFGQRSVAVLMMISDRRHPSQYQHLAHWETGPAGHRTLHFVAHMKGYMLQLLQDTTITALNVGLNSRIRLLFVAAIYFLV